MKHMAMSMRSRVHIYIGVGTGYSEVMVIFCLLRKIPGYFASHLATTTSLPLYCLPCVISGVRREVDGDRALRGHYSASSGDS